MIGATLFALALPATAAAAHCPDSPLRPTVEGNYPAGCYVYEMVSPPDKGNGEAGGGLPVGTVTSDDGSRILWGADGLFVSAPTLFQINPYSSTRTSAGWSTSSPTSILPSFVPNLVDEDLSGSDGPSNVFPNGLSADGRFTVMGSDRDPATGAKQPSGLYRIDMETGTSQRITPAPVAGNPRVASDVGNQAGVTGNADFSEILFSSPGQLTPASTSVPAFEEKLYRWANGTTELISYTPSGAPQPGVLASAINDDHHSSRYLTRNSLSADGRTFWFGASSSWQYGHRLFRGEVGSTASTEIASSENPAQPGPGRGGIMGASADGQRAIFWSRSALLPGLTASNSGIGQIFLYTHSADPDGDDNLTLISADSEPADGTGDTQALLGVSDDARTVYFASANQLVSGETTAPGSKLYRWHDGTLRFIGLSPEAVTPNGDFQVSSDGRFLLYVPVPEWTGTGQAYRYDAETDQLDCVSCPTSGSPVGRTEIDFSPTAFWSTRRPLRALADDGRVVFATATPLLAADTNGMPDVYTWKDGATSLISTGRSPSLSRIGGMSTDGTSIFFYTRDALSGWDNDTRQDLYVARLDGGVPEPNPRPAENCTGDACQGSRTPAPPAPIVGSVTFAGTGDVVTPPWVSASPRVSRVQAVRSRQATLRISVPGEGRIRVSGNRLQRVNRSSSKAQRLNVRVRLSNLGERTRQRRGQVRVNVAVRFTPSEGRVRTVRVPVTFRADRASSSRSSSTRSAKSKSTASAKSSANSNAKGGR